MVRLLITREHFAAEILLVKIMQIGLTCQVHNASVHDETLPKTTLLRINITRATLSVPVLLLIIHAHIHTANVLIHGCLSGHRGRVVRLSMKNIFLKQKSGKAPGYEYS